MEFPFDIHTVLPFEITIVNGDYRILNQGQTSRIGGSEKLTSIIDTLGEASYKAQGLPGPVTTARKFRISDHRLYLIKGTNDQSSNSVVGLLKVGEKHLYVYDPHGQVYERTPLCVLDFYVHESKQRSGYGKRLFDAMLEFEKCNAHELAIDRPSNKCLGFLQKHFHLSAPIRQVNNFVVFSAFFNRSSLNQNLRRTSASKQRHDSQRPSELNSWMFPSEKQPTRRPFSEQNDPSRVQRTRPVSNDSELLNHYRQKSGVSSMISESQTKPPPIPNSYTYQYAHNSLLRDPFKTTAPVQSAPHVPRHYAELFNENNPFPSLQRHNTNPVISATKTTNPSAFPNYTYKDYQSGSAVNATRPTTEKPAAGLGAGADSLTSVYTFPSLIKTNSRLQRSNTQPSTIDASSSAWRLFGVHRLLN